MSRTLDRTEDDARRMAMALAEAGYPHADVRLDAEGALTYSFDVPRYVAWKAAAIIGVSCWCWPCRRLLPHHFGSSIPEPCGHHIDPFCPEDA